MERLRLEEAKKLIRDKKLFSHSLRVYEKSGQFEEVRKFE